MSTRGFLGFVIDGREKIAYNHDDSYPSGLGRAVLTWLRAASADSTDYIAGRARALRVVDPDSTPTPEDVERLRGSDVLTANLQRETDWYSLLRTKQGNPAAILEAGVIEDASDFPTESLSARWGYIVDLDRGVFEAYVGLQVMPHSKGRFADRPGFDLRYGYEPCALVAEWQFNVLPTDDEFTRVLEARSRVAA